MRIVGGEFRGRALGAPRSQDIRPTTDRTRESLFNILAHSYPEALCGRVIDLFAGTGALGFEALSRGCRQGLFVEISTEGRGLIRDNIEALGLLGRARILRRDATQLGGAGTIEPFHLLFADPPYAQSLGEKALISALKGGWLVEGALAIVEERADIQLGLPEDFTLVEERSFGDTKMHFLRRK